MNTFPTICHVVLALDSAHLQSIGYDCILHPQMSDISVDSLSVENVFGGLLCRLPALVT